MTNRALRSRRRLAIAMIALALLGLVIAAYYYSFCFLRENDCFLQREGACEALTRTMRFAVLVGGVSLGLGLAGAIVAFRSRRQLRV